MRPLASTLNCLSFQTVANLATVKLGSDGKVSMYTRAIGLGRGAHLAADRRAPGSCRSPAAAGCRPPGSRPTGVLRPLASNLNFRAGQTTPNVVVAKAGAGGKVSVSNGSTGTTHFVADVAGWYGQE